MLTIVVVIVTVAVVLIVIAINTINYPRTYESRENFEAAEEPKDEKVAELLARSGGGAQKLGFMKGL